MKNVIKWVAGAVLSAAALPALAQGTDPANFPSGQVKIIVTATAGASSDALTRTVGRELGKIWGKDPIIENIPGGNGNIGLQQTATSKPDGLTIAVGGDKVPLNAIFFGKDLSYDPVNDLTAVTKAVANPSIIVVKPDLGVKNLEEYLALAKKRGGKLTVGTTGNGGAHHLIHVLLAQQTSSDFTYVAYKGGAPAVTDILGGHIDAIVITLAAVTEHVRAGRLIPIGVSTKDRSAALPDVPTFAEQGVKDFNTETWQGFFVSAKTPRPLVEKINKDFATALNSPDVKKYLEGQGFVVTASSVDDAEKTVKGDFEKFKDVIQKANITLD